MREAFKFWDDPTKVQNFSERQFVLSPKEYCVYPNLMDLVNVLQGTVAFSL